MATQLMLPKEKTAKIEAIRQIMNTGMSFRAPLRVEWIMAYWHLQGVRRFSVASWRTGRVLVSRESPEGVFEMRVEDVLNKYQRELGRLMRINTLPYITRKKLGLDDIRNAAIGQVVMDELANQQDPEYTKKCLLEALLIFGTAGLASWCNKEVGLDLKTRKEVILPWEMIPCPGRPTMEHQHNGIVRHRWVPYEWLRETQPSLKYPKKDSKSNPDPCLNLRYIQPGTKIEDMDSVDDEMANGGYTDRGEHREDVPDVGVPYVELKEIWGPDDMNRVCSYDVLLGQHLAKEVYYEDETNARNRPPLPIGIARYNHSGGWWGRSFVGPLLGIAIEVERMMANLFENVKNLDQFGFLWLPNTLQIHKEDLKSTVRPRIITGEPDYNAPQIKPEHITPFNSGDAPGRVAATGLQLLDRLSRESDLYSGKAPGRVDSASGLGLLYETSSIPTIPVAASIAHAYAQVYKADLFAAKQLLGSQDMLKISVLDDNIAGIVIDPKTGTMSLDSNPIPHPDDVMVSIKEREPKMVTQTKQELIQLLQLGIVDPEEFIWINYIENLGFKTGNKMIIEERRKGMLRNIIQFGDGQTPGGITPSTKDQHAIQIRVLKDFMSQPSFQLASVDVRSAFEQRLAFHEAGMGGFPEGLPNPEDMAVDAAQWGQGGGGPLPPSLQSSMDRAGIQEQGMGQPPQFGPG